MSAGKNKDKNRGPSSGKKPVPEQGALGDLMSKSAGSTHITDSREVLNPASKPQPKPAITSPTQPPTTSVSASSVDADAIIEAPVVAPIVPHMTVATSPVVAPVSQAAPIITPQAAAAKPAKIEKAASAKAAPIDIIAEIRGTGAGRFKKLPGETSSNLLVTIALVISMLIHVAVGVVMAKQTAGKLAVPLIDEEIVETFRVTAPPPEDPIFSDPLLTSDQPVATPAKQPGLGEISKQLLLNRVEGTPISATDTTPAPQPARVEHPDLQPAAPKVDLTTGDAKALDLPSDITANLAGAGTVELPIVTGTSTTPAAAPTTTTGAGPSTTAQARSMLKGMIPTGPAGSGFNFANSVTVPSPVGPVVADSAPTIDRRLLESPSTAPPIEVTAIALSEARNLDIPEKLDDDFDYLVTKFRPEIGGGLFQSAKPDRYTYFKVDITAKRSLRKLKTMPKDVIFLLDTSGSVPQEWVNAMTRGVRDGLSSLNEGDRFNIVFFNDKTSLFADDKIATADTATLARAQQFLTGAMSKGNTDINRSLSRLLQRDTSAQRAYYLIFISDGIPTQGVMDTRELINLVTRDNDLSASIYCIGVGNSQNKELLNFLAYRNKGASTFAREPAQASAAIRDLMSKVRYPILKDVNLNVIGLDFEEVFPHNLPNIHQGETFSIFGRYELGGAFTMRVGGHNGLKAMDVTFGGDLLAARTGEKTIPEEWAFWKLHHVYSEIIRQGQRPELKAKIDELKQRFDLKTLY